MPPLTPVASQFVSARSLWRGARLLLENPDYQGSGYLVLPAHTLLGFAMENYLKAFLLKNGVSEKELKSRDLRHDIAKLYEMAKEHGLSMPGSEFEGLRDAIASRHADFGNRYLKEGEYIKINTAVVVVVMNEIDKIVGNSMLEDLSPFGGFDLLSP